MLNQVKMWRISDSNEESMILEKIKRRRQCDNQNQENNENELSEDRLSDLPDGVILHILSFLNTKHVVPTCVLSARWKHIWKRTPALTLYASRFSISKQFPRFVSKILTLRDTSTALHALDLDSGGVIEPPLLKKILNYICSHNTHLQELGISVIGDTDLIMRCVSSCQTLTSLKLSLYPRGRYNSTEILFPKSLNLPALTSLELTNFTFCGGENGCAKPFLAFNRLNNLVIHSCTVKDGQTFNISSETLVNLAMYDNSLDFDKIELSAPSLCTFTFIGEASYGTVELAARPCQCKIIDNIFNYSSEVKLHYLCNSKSLEVELTPLHRRSELPFIKNVMLKKAAAKSRKEVATLRKVFKAGLKPPPVPDGIVGFLLQNSLSAKVDFTTKYPGTFKLKQDDKLSNEDKVESHQPNSNSLLDNGQ
ncbi:hypothetical protein TSUD_84670 [Trifolium subterraneum]|uniref:F-box domain-containing protein n=1 Tax=Trifolium subterraneum TaxID=3900 RepID=A0A2Z6PTU4_TRISU|nr:hypothetical protein TSUD_84670 [Trifolium subterraneum]